MQPQTFIFFGTVGSGKGTQVKLLVDFLKEKTGKESVYAGTGEGFRKLMQAGNYTSKLIEEYVAEGKLVPDFITNAVFTDILIKELSPEKHLIADGYPRTIPQSESFEKKMEFYKRGNVKIIYLELSEQEAMKRNLLRGRHDDTEEGLKQRFNEYKNNVIPSMQYFKDKPGYNIFRINGEQTIEQVHSDIIKALNF